MNIDVHLKMEFMLIFFLLVDETKKQTITMRHWQLALLKFSQCRWDMLTADLELVETIDGYCDVVYGTYEPKYLNWYFPLITFTCMILMQG